VNSVQLTKKRNKIPVGFKAIQAVFPWVEKVSPDYAKRWAAHLFFRPVKFKFPESELQKRVTATERDVQVNGFRIREYSWGEGPVVLFVHGWSGRGLQFRKFIYPLVARGYKVVTYDAPAHGNSSGTKTNVVEMAEICQSMAQQFDNLHAIIAHSIGGIAAMRAIDKGLKVPRLVLLATPCRGQDIVNGFTNMIGGSWQISNHLIKIVEDQFAIGLCAFDASPLLKEVLAAKQLQVKLIYDEDDAEVKLESVQRILSDCDPKDVLMTKHLGHNGLLRDEGVVRTIEAFLMSSSIKPRPKPYVPAEMLA
jgi:pimeloyl-ACP methyl ester carboxylesterase